MNAWYRNTLWTFATSGILLVAACSSSTTIQSDLILDGNAGAKLTLKQKTQALDVFNTSQAPVRVIVLDKRERVISDIMLDAHDGTHYCMCKGCHRSFRAKITSAKNGGAWATEVTPAEMPV